MITLTFETLLRRMADHADEASLHNFATRLRGEADLVKDETNQGATRNSGERRSGRSKLVYDKAKRTIVTVATNSAVPVAGAVDTAEIIRRLKSVSRRVSAGEHLTMSVPVDHSRDADVICQDAAAALETLDRRCRQYEDMLRKKGVFIGSTVGDGGEGGV